jgi:hypothetical protein
MTNEIRPADAGTSDAASNTASPPRIDPAHIREFARRNRAEVEQQKREHWARFYHERGSREALQLSHALYEHARRLRPDFPTERQREEDLAHHIKLKAMIDRAAHAFPVR